MAWLLHPVCPDLHVPGVVFSTEYERRTLAEDRGIVDRIIAAYHHARQSATARVRESMFGTVWEAEGFGGRQGALLRALDERSAARTHDILKRFFISDAAHGIALGPEQAEAVRHEADQARAHGLVWLDRLVGLAHAVGARPAINPESHAASWERALDVDAAETGAAIERTCDVSLAFPDVLGVYGPQLRGRPFPHVAFTHLLVALSLRAWVPPEGGDVVEIGGGFGGLAYWTTGLAPCRYTVYDLPFANAAQAYFLWRARPGGALRLAGEPAQGDREIALLPGWRLLQDPPASADVVVNQDSLPEIPREVARAYLDAVRRCLAGPLVSVNHEGWQQHARALDRTSVAQLMTDVGGYTRVSRGPFALRVGYVQEIYVPTGATLRVGARGLPPRLPPEPRGRLARLLRRLSR